LKKGIIKKKRVHGSEKHPSSISPPTKTAQHGGLGLQAASGRPAGGQRSATGCMGKRNPYNASTSRYAPDRRLGRPTLARRRARGCGVHCLQPRPAWHEKEIVMPDDVVAPAGGRVHLTARVMQHPLNHNPSLLPPAASRKGPCLHVHLNASPCVHPRSACTALAQPKPPPSTISIGAATGLHYHGHAQPHILSPLGLGTFRLIQDRRSDRPRTCQIA